MLLPLWPLILFYLFVGLASSKHVERTYEYFTKWSHSEGHSHPAPPPVKLQRLSLWADETMRSTSIPYPHKILPSLFIHHILMNGWERDVSGDCYVVYSSEGEKECLSEETIRHKLHDDRSLFAWSSSSVLELNKAERALTKASVKERFTKRELNKEDFIVEAEMDIKLI
ncbi:Microsomal triglyceride transfer protein variant b, partial [Caligus rogercresseyi]